MDDVIGRKCKSRVQADEWRRAGRGSGPAPDGTVGRRLRAACPRASRCPRRGRVPARARPTRACAPGPPAARPRSGPGSPRARRPVATAGAPSGGAPRPCRQARRARRRSTRRSNSSSPGRRTTPRSAPSGPGARRGRYPVPRRRSPGRLPSGCRRRSRWRSRRPRCRSARSRRHSRPASRRRLRPRRRHPGRVCRGRPPWWPGVRPRLRRAHAPPAGRGAGAAACGPAREWSPSAA